MKNHKKFYHIFNPVSGPTPNVSPLFCVLRVPVLTPNTTIPRTPLPALLAPPARSEGHHCVGVLPPLTTPADVTSGLAARTAISAPLTSLYGRILAAKSCARDSTWFLFWFLEAGGGGGGRRHWFRRKSPSPHPFLSLVPWSWLSERSLSQLKATFCGGIPGNGYCMVRLFRSCWKPNLLYYLI